MSGSEPPSGQVTGVTCPRCGGATRVRKPAIKNPFLTKRSAPELLSCEDCGLDFERPADSGRSPWSKPE